MNWDDVIGRTNKYLYAVAKLMTTYINTYDEGTFVERT